MRAAILLGLALLATCDTQGLEPAGEARVVSQEAECLAGGGRWGEAGASGLMICYQPTRDAGQSCQASAECQGFCLARSRTCAPVTPLFGCNDVLGRSGVTSTVCIE